MCASAFSSSASESPHGAGELGHDQPAPARLRINLRKTVSVTPAIGASTVAGETVTPPMRNSLGKRIIPKLF